VEAARHLVGVAVELAAGVEHGHHDFERGPLLLRVHVGGNAAAVVLDRNAAVPMHGDEDPVARARQRLIDRVVDDFVDEVVQAAGRGAADVHARAAAHRIEPLEHLDILGGVGRSLAARGQLAIRTARDPRR